jgi:hypothetical protein
MLRKLIPVFLACVCCTATAYDPFTTARLRAMKAIAHSANNTTLVNGLVGYWNFDDGTFSDSSGVGYAFTNYSTVTTQAGRIGLGARVTKAAQSRLYVEDTSAYAFATNQSFSVSFWANVTSHDTYAEFIGKRRNDTSPYYGWSVGVVTNNRLYADFREPSSSTPWSATTNAMSTWQHYILVVDKSVNTMVVYKNNVVDVGPDSLTGINHFSTHYGFYLGHPANGGTRMDCTFDEVAVWNRVITADERTELYNSGNGKKIK